MGSKKDCCNVECVRSLLTIYNIILFLTGAAVIGIFSWIICTSYIYIPLLSSQSFPVLLYCLLSCGVLVIGGAVVLGCCGVHRRSQILLLCYVFVLIFVFLLEIMVGVLAYMYQETVRENLKLNLNDTILNYYGHRRDITNSVDNVQEKFKCCGSEWVVDWKASSWYLTSDMGQTIPDSCCKTISPGCGKVSDRPSNININGCLEKIADSASQCLWLMSATGFGLCWVQIFGVIFGLCLYMKLKNDDYKVEDPLIDNLRYS